MTQKREVLPGRREGDLVSVDLGDELVVYDPRSGQTHALNQPAALVWRALAKAMSIERLTAQLSKTGGADLTEDAVWLALKDLARRGLLDGPLPAAARRGVSRRDLLRRLAAAGVIAPAVLSVRSVQAAVVLSPTTCSNPVTDCFVNPDPPFKCSTQTLCFCITTTEGINVCIVGSCAQMPCAVSSQCPPGYVCWANSCCSTSADARGPQAKKQAVVSGNCMPLCGNVPTAENQKKTTATGSFWNR